MVTGIVCERGHMENVEVSDIFDPSVVFPPCPPCPTCGGTAKYAKDLDDIDDLVSASKEKPMKPSLGRIVFYKNELGDCNAAIIVMITDPRQTNVNLMVFGGEDGFRVEAMANVPYLTEDADPDKAGWFWPPRIDG